MCEVPLDYGAQDTFQIQLYTEKVKGEMKSAFFVNGLGLAPTTSTQSPMHLLRPLGSLGDVIAPAVHNLNNMITNLVRNDMAHVIYVNLTDRKETSRYSSKTDRMSVSDWIKKTKTSNRNGGGTSVKGR